MPLTAYLAGPDVFLPRASANAAAKIAICARHGLTGLAPFNPNIDYTQPPETLWRQIYLDDIAMMQASDLIIANLTPFRGASADAGTLVEVGWFLGRARPVFGYSNTAAPFAARSAAQTAAMADPLPNLAIETFNLPDNLMVPGAVEYGGGLPVTLPPDNISRPFDSLDIFELCVAAAARHLRV
ncbi:nucleoside 2-deoxyribosyltransferase [Acidocella aquatica]|uniref:Nucleoside 2-deoxyribosyltransferase n=1 Tax=Acidocella aquatica TaxID=1922313 RepID=A0ABQ6A4M1_9PROT|nr:nucleoside 2-deoxyribosyltransferase [Acidocella aquatica]GLR66791.1 nucleoside 2-deoxyribosyltransferase [Acidocella aquatica]